jgi:hypothetical protein
MNFKIFPVLKNSRCLLGNIEMRDDINPVTIAHDRLLPFFEIDFPFILRVNFPGAHVFGLCIRRSFL